MAMRREAAATAEDEDMLPYGGFVAGAANV
jgi:hypothetical protein